MCICEVCGAEFERKNPKGRAPSVCYDPACQEVIKNRERARMRERYYHRRDFVPKKKRSALEELARLACEAGMTYGQYVAQMEVCK